MGIKVVKVFMNGLINVIISASWFLSNAMLYIYLYFVKVTKTRCLVNTCSSNTYTTGQGVPLDHFNPSFSKLTKVFHFKFLFQIRFYAD